MKACHSGVDGGHFGRDKTISKVGGCSGPNYAASKLSSSYIAMSIRMLMDLLELPKDSAFCLYLCAKLSTSTYVCTRLYS